ncbi:MAG: hypothetical protein CM15mP126_5540 [Gammaproteobacteria bacterium]|nr:MAG: hypothetical protein CM15mP126_5540 [Gammaproteobacteria bacterium]
MKMAQSMKVLDQKFGTRIGENWNATLVYSEQTIDSDGVFFADPNLGDLEIQRYSDDGKYLINMKT